MRSILRAGLALGLAATLLTGRSADAEPDLAELLGFVVQTLPLDDLVPGSPVTVEGSADSVVLSWDGNPDAEVLVRRHGPEGWGPWVEVDAAPDEAPDIGTEAVSLVRTVVGPVWTGAGTDAIDVQAVDAVLNGVTVDLLDDVGDVVEEVQRFAHDLSTDPVGAVQGVVDDLLRPPPAAPAPPAPPAMPPIYDTSAWGSPGWSYSTPGCEAGPRTAPLQRVIVHHTVQTNSYSPEQVPAMIRSVYYSHLARGFCDIGYNFVVDAYGRMWQARSGPVNAAVIGGHARGWNTGSVGISLLGQHHPGASPPAAQPTGASLSAVAAIARWQFQIHGAAPHVIGHRDVGATACPGDYVYGRLDEIRAQM
ncbi:MAG: N-acetylmuramoyl-L-alanine amidase [Acidimicrobiales bacterium]